MYAYLDAFVFAKDGKNQKKNREGYYFFANFSYISKLALSYSALGWVYYHSAKNKSATVIVSGDTNCS